MLSDEQIERYSRHIILPQMGARGQQRLLAAAVAVVGDGTASTTAGLYLAAAGVGKLSITQSNDTLRDLATLNPDCHITHLPPSLISTPVTGLVRAHDVIIDASGSDPVSAAFNRACVELGKPLVWGRAANYGGQVTVVAGPGRTRPCLACLKVESVLPGGDQLAMLAAWFVGTLQATEAIKLVLGVGDTLGGRMVVYDLLEGAVRQIEVARDPACTVCR
jgi:molybdopterin/thiamine biosynthesis adenylyltransferase